MNRHSSNPPFDSRIEDLAKRTMRSERLGPDVFTADGNSDARTHERSFLYLLTAFDPSDQKPIRQKVPNRAAPVCHNATNH